MKKLVKNSVFVFIFAFAFFVLSLSTVKAAEAALDNTTVKGATSDYVVAGNDYFVVKGSAEDKTLVLESKTDGARSGLFKNYYPYSAAVSVIKCSSYNASIGVCDTWAEYKYSTDRYATMDALKQNGLTLNFKAASFTPIAQQQSINGQSLGKLNSTNGVVNTYFVIVQYRLEKGWLAKSIDYDPDVFRVIFTENVLGLDLTKADQSGSVKVTATSGLPITSMRYFSTTTALTAGFDFDTEYNNAGNGVTYTTDKNKAPSANNGVFSSEVTLTSTAGTYYYVEAKDAGGNVKVLDVSANQQSDNTPSGGNDQDQAKGNVGNTDVGKIILIALLVVLVISLVLVIVQRIVDYRRKIY